MAIETIWVLILTGSLLAGLLTGLPVIFVIAGVPTAIGLIAAWFGAFEPVYFQAVPQRILGVMENRLLVAVPLFVLVGVMLDRSRQAERMLNNITRAMGGSRTGLALSVIFVSALIAASTGIIGATIVMLGTITLPSMLRAGIDEKTSSGLICACGTLGQIIPPSIVLILLGDQISNAYIEAQQIAGNFAPDPVTVGDLFAGALLPGLLLVALYALYVVLRVGRLENAAPEPAPQDPMPLSELVLGTLPTLALIVAVLGSILLGVATPTEAAGVGVAGTILIALAQTSRGHAVLAGGLALLAVGLLILSAWGGVRAEFDSGALVWSGQTLLLAVPLAVLGAGMAYAARVLIRVGILGPAITETLIVSGMIFGIIIAASVLSLVFRGFGGDEMVAHLLESLPGGTWGMLALTMLVIFLLGFLLEFVEIIFIVIPIVGPILLQQDISPVWFAVLVAMNLQTSFLTPPFGFALFYYRSVAPPQISTTAIYRAIVPFVLIQIAAIGLVVLFPGLATWLPGVLF